MAKLASLLLILAISTVAVNAAQSGAVAASSIEFIRTSCSSTLYPDLCFSSLSPYASTINHSPLKLSQVAISLSLSRIRSVSSHVSASLFSTTPTSTNSARKVTVTKALKDCTQVLGNAADRTKDSMAELNKLKNAANMKETELRWCLSNVQTWMSGALTNEDTCTDGLKEAGGIARTCTDVGVAKEYTSNALALVNKLTQPSPGY